MGRTASQGVRKSRKPVRRQRQMVVGRFWSLGKEWKGSERQNSARVCPAGVGNECTSGKREAKLTLNPLDGTPTSVPGIRGAVIGGRSLQAVAPGLGWTLVGKWPGPPCRRRRHSGCALKSHGCFRQGCVRSSHSPFCVLHSPFSMSGCSCMPALETAPEWRSGRHREVKERMRRKQQ